MRWLGATWPNSTSFKMLKLKSIQKIFTSFSFLKQIKKSLQSIKLTQTNDNEEKSIKGIAKPNILINPSTNQSNPMNNNPIKILRRPPSDKNLKDMGSQNQNK